MELHELFWISVLTAGPAAFWLRWLRRRDLHVAKKRNGRMVLYFFAAGMVSAPLCTLFYFTNPYEPWIDSTVAYYFLVNAPSEELAKFLVFWAVARVLGSVKDPVDALIQGAAVGVGFAFVENLGYSSRIDLACLAVRGVFSLAGHGTYTALAAFAWGVRDYYAREERGLVSRGLPILGLVSATCLHASFNSLGILGPVASDWMFFLDVCCIAILTWALVEVRALSPYRSLPSDRWREALRSIDLGLARDPDNWILHQRKGIYLISAGRLEEAEESFFLAWALNPAPLPRAWLLTARRLRGTAGTRDLAAAIREIPMAGRGSFIAHLRSAASGLPGGTSAVREVTEAIAPAQSRKPSPAWDSIPGIMDRRRSSIVHARALRDRARAARTACTAGRQG